MSTSIETIARNARKEPEREPRANVEPVGESIEARVEVVPLRQGDAAIFAVHNRPVEGKRGYYRVNLRHGVSRIRSGHRHTTGVIFHDAK